jgi:hypothetical protein
LADHEPVRCSVTKAFFDPDQSAYCRDQGFVDISPNADGGVLKRVIKEGKFADKAVEEGCPTFGNTILPLRVSLETLILWVEQ